MALNSVNTNMGAAVALQSLNRTNDALAVTQKRISTGFRVADAKDDGAAFAVAQAVRADIAGLTSANEQIGGVKGVLDTTLSSLNKVSETMGEIRGVLVKLADGTLSDSQRTQYQSQYDSLRTQVSNYISDATYNGRTLLSTASAAGSVGGNIATVRNESGTTYTLSAVDGANLTVASTTFTAAAAATALASGGDFATKMAAVSTALNTFGSNNKYLEGQVSYNKEKMDALETGLGALVDADLAKESAKLQALQIKQQLGTQSLSIANQAPQSLLSLFR
ncbi:flagellin [Roseomonas sp. SSH11]|uniref:Flagellin n=1 Tax=Pararoseomonas baculiformis TaxID=2820812 RepID=A0ABS4AET2_9PROT|nr:flagellin [Pararoseomonas baculiformis]MBP0445503.1 flagellin [Pararoseomonas baculiformis]